MNVPTKTLPALFALLTLGLGVAAHPGHDHDHWLSPAVHGVLFVSIVAIICAGVWAYRKRRRPLNTIKKEENR